MERRVDAEVPQVEKKCGRTCANEDDSQSSGTLSERDDEDFRFGAEPWLEQGPLTLDARRLSAIQ